jgi:endoglucanase
VGDSGLFTVPPPAEGGVPLGDASAGVEAATSAHPMAPNGYYVVGPTIYDSSNQPHLFHGLDRPSLEWDPQGEGQTGEGIPAQDFTAMAAWGANVVRISLNQDFWIQGAALYNSNYSATVAEAVSHAEAAGLDVILDLHWSDQGNLAVGSNCTTNDTAGCTGQQPMADANSITFWNQVAAAYKGDGHVMFELYNEPNNILPPVWLNGGTPMNASYTAVGMQQLYNAVRTTAGADNIVLIGGLNWAYDLSQVVNGTAVTGFNIIYVTHPYSQSGTLDQQPDWPTYFGNLAAIDPVMATEFGDNTCDTSYESSIITYFDMNKISWSAFAWWYTSSNPCGFPTLLTTWPSTPSATGQVVMTALLAEPAQP